MAEVVLTNISNICSLQKEENFVKSNFSIVIVNVYAYDR